MPHVVLLRAINVGGQSVARPWLRLVEGVSPDRWDLIGATVALAGMAIIAFAPRG